MGIGAAIARHLSERGARVIVTYRSHEPSEDDLSRLSSRTGPATALRADLTSEAEVDELGSRLERDLNRIDVVVHNAGGLIERASVAQMTYELFRRVQALNVDSVFLVTRRLLPLMGDGGRIVVVSSLAGRSGGHAGATAYATSKAALFGFVRGLAKEVAADGITVNAVAPGFIDSTPFHETFTTATSKAETIRSIPVGRAGVPKDVAAAVGWLASDGSSFVTGAIIDINGGQHFS